MKTMYMDISKSDDDAIETTISNNIEERENGNVLEIMIICLNLLFPYLFHEIYDNYIIWKK